jgi:hypothetical protein
VVEDEVLRRRRLATEALLAQRLHSFVRLDEGRYADAGLISHAEYQLCLDERWAEVACRQPDHWPDGRFPWGQGQAPVVGVRYSDAQAYCRWLTERDPDGWRYRLPRVGELEGSRAVLDGLSAGGGYWAATGGSGRKFVPASRRACALGNVTVADWIRRDLAVGRDLYEESARALVYDLATALGLDPTLERAHALELTQNLADVLGRDLERARDLDRALADSLSSALDHARALDHGLDGVRARPPVELVAQAHELDRILSVALYRAHAIPRARRLARATVRAHNQARELCVVIARASVSDVASALLLTRNRSSATDHAHRLAQAIVGDLDHDAARDLASDLGYVHILSRVNHFDLALDLFRGRDNIAPPLDLDRLAELDLARDPDRVQEIDRLRDPANDPALDPDRSRAGDYARARELERLRTGDLTLAGALSRAGELARAQAVACGAELGSTRDVSITRDASITRALSWVLERDANAELESRRKEASGPLRQYIRFGALALALEWGALLQVRRGSEVGGFSGPGDARRERLVTQRDAAIEVYAGLSILEDRIEGTLPAWEGIRIVREGGSGSRP